MSRHSRQQALLAAYYTNLCPLEAITQWLKPAVNALPLEHREISMSMAKEDGKEIYRRWLSFKNPEELRAELLRTKPIPHKFDIGAVYSKPVASRDDILKGDIPFYPLAREFVLDIDMNDYDEIRTCCEGKKLCRLCWRFLAAAALLIDETLREDCAFEEILWVFSGRRGIHCWVTDLEAKRMAGSARSAVAAYLVLIPQQRLNAHMVPLKGRYMRRAVKVLRRLWPLILQEQDVYFHYLTSGGGATQLESLKTSLITLLPSVPVGTIFEELVKPTPSNWEGRSHEFWKQLACKLKQHSELAQDALDVIMVHTLQPRLDINVSKDVGHLLKAPFVIHQGTGKVCCPLRLAEIEAFDPELVPLVSQLLPIQTEAAENVCQDAGTAALKTFQLWVQDFQAFIQHQQAHRLGDKPNV
eukprot:Protomagalhaensia_wolfi_Nauph_80__1447@NODE_1872_length_1295_cov_4_882166_g1463_i0_p1_GENE_NODE_1872_length_1295_cov_4_882166_g1463_i0NODE_1872_length_1295_cov_4_882166_g1463_i0_p1_ORF_typecomplete_len414_score85_65DNA_primase_S/PF01896_19/1_1e48_NODE_1872_length_1295_cov_4_882166_g1463_i0281269